MIKNITLAFFSIILALPLFAQEKILLRLKPDLSNTFPQSVHMTADMKAGEQSSTIDASMKSEITNIMATDSTLTYSAKYTEMTMVMDLGIFAINYDSKNPEANEFSKQMHEKIKLLFEKPILSTMRLNGQVIEIENLPENSEFFDLNMLKEATFEYPPHELTIGDQWQATVKNEKVGLINQTYTLKGITVDGIKIDSEGSINIEGKTVGSIKGTYLLHPKTHYLKTVTVITTVKNDNLDVTSKIEIQ